MKKALAIVCALMMLLSLAACGKGNDVVGTYRIFSMESDGTTITRETMLAMGVTEADLDDMFVVEMKDDGTCSISMSGDSAEGTYADGTITIAGEEMPYEYKDGKLTLTLTEPGGAASATMVFEKME